MKIQIHKPVDQDLNLDKLVKKTIVWICSQLNIEPVSIDIILTGDEQLKQMHKQFLGEDHITDVITFNLSDSADQIESEIYISVDSARRQAIQYKVSFEQEISRLVIHGCMHLAGYNDDTEQTQNTMKKIEDQYVELVQNKFLTTE